MEIMAEAPAVSSSGTEQPGMADSGASKVGSGSDLGRGGVGELGQEGFERWALLCTLYLLSCSTDTPSSFQVLGWMSAGAQA